jgi:hypothetical protein
MASARAVVAGDQLDGGDWRANAMKIGTFVKLAAYADSLGLTAHPCPELRLVTATLIFTPAGECTRDAI